MARYIEPKNYTSPPLPDGYVIRAPALEANGWMKTIIVRDGFIVKKRWKPERKSVLQGSTSGGSHSTPWTPGTSQGRFSAMGASQSRISARGESQGRLSTSDASQARLFVTGASHGDLSSRL